MRQKLWDWITVFLFNAAIIIIYVASKNYLEIFRPEIEQYTVAYFLHIHWGLLALIAMLGTIFLLTKNHFLSRANTNRINWLFFLVSILVPLLYGTIGITYGNLIAD